MKRKHGMLIGGIVVAAAAVVGIAYGTPIVGLVSPIFSVGQHASDIRTHGIGHTPSGQRFEVELETEGPATMSNQDGAFGAGGHNGWHSHPGMVAVTMISPSEVSPQAEHSSSVLRTDSGHAQLSIIGVRRHARGCARGRVNTQLFGSHMV